MKRKIGLLIIIIALVFCVSGCNLRERRRKLLIEFYTKDAEEVFVQFEGVLMAIEEDEEYYFLMIKPTWCEYSYSLPSSIQEYPYMGENASELEEIPIGSVIKYRTNPYAIFQSGMGEIRGVMELYYNDKCYLSFKDGQQAMLDWVEKAYAPNSKDYPWEWRADPDAVVVEYVKWYIPLQDTLFLDYYNEFYNNSDNHMQLKGVITEKNIVQKEIKVRIVEYDNLYFEFFEGDLPTEILFNVICEDEKLEGLQIGDEISFKTGITNYIPNMPIPMLEIYKDGINYLEFEEGKDNYLEFLSTYTVVINYARVIKDDPQRIFYE